MKGLASKPATAEQSNSPFRSYGSRKSAVQTKLQVNKPGDAHEMEADQAAEKVVNQPKDADTLARKPISHSITPLQRKEEVQAKEEEVQSKEEDSLQAKEDVQQKEELQKKESPQFKKDISWNNMFQKKEDFVQQKEEFQKNESPQFKNDISWNNTVQKKVDFLQQKEELQKKVSPQFKNDFSWNNTLQKKEDFVQQKEELQNKESPQFKNDISWNNTLQKKEDSVQRKEEVQMKESEIAPMGMPSSAGEKDPIRAAVQRKEEVQMKEAEIAPMGMPSSAGEKDPIRASVQRKEELQAKEKEELQLQEEVQLNEEKTPVQMKCAECEAREKSGIQTKCEKCQENSTIQAKQDSSASENKTVSQLSSSKGGGFHMAPEILEEMESGFGTDFSDVRIHTDASAVQMNKSLGAQAFTHKKDIYFNSGKYAPETKQGKLLLAHELTHTIQQQAIPRFNVIQKKAQKLKRNPKTDAQKIVSLLQGWTDSSESHRIYKIFQTSSSSHILEIMNYLKNGTFSDVKGWDMVEWLLGDVTDYDRFPIVKELVRANSPDATKYVAKTIVNDLIAGYTSEDDNDLILKYIELFNSSALSDLLASIKKRTGGSLESGLFGEVNAVTANSLMKILYAKGGVAANYAAYYAAKRIESLLIGWTGVNDSRAIVRYFRIAPPEVRRLIISKLDVLTDDRWKEKAENTLMKNMYEEDYNAIEKLGVGFRKYDIKRNWWARRAHDFVWGLDYVLGWLQYYQCGVIGALWGIFVALIEVVTTIGEAVIFGIPALMGWIAYHVTGGKTGRDGYNKVNKFFSGFSKMFHVVDMWNQVKLEADLMEGSFSECKKAFHYTNKVFQSLTNIALIFLAGYGLVKGGIKLVKNASKLGKLATLQKFVKGTKTSLAKGGKAVTSLITKPRVVLRYSKARINKIMFAALDEGYYLNLRKQSMKNSAKERIYWKKYKGKWKKTATKKEKTANELEKNYTQVENQKDPTKAEKLAKETNEKTEQLNKETFNELEDIKKGKNGKFGVESSLDNLPEGGAYGKLDGKYVIGYEKHHMPADAVSPLSRYKGGAIQMTEADHALTASYKSTKSAKLYRAKQKSYIDAGDFKSAFEMDVKDIRSKFGDKYDKAIEQAHQYYVKEGMFK